MDEREIEGWALRRDFEALTPAEQRLVIARLGSREEYDRMRRALTGARRVLSDESARLIPDPAIAAQLRDVLAQRRRARPTRGMPAGRSFAGRMLTFRVPALGAGLVAATLVGIALLFGPPRRSDDATHVVEHLVTVHDTVRVATLDPTQLRKITDSVHEEVHAAMAAERLAALRSAGAAGHRLTERTGHRNGDTLRNGEEPSIESAETGRNQFVGLANLPRLDHQRRGKSLDEDSISKRFAVMMPRGN